MDYTRNFQALLNSRVSNFFPTTLGNSAWFEHIPFAYWLLEKIKPRSYLEMGVHNGVSYFAICEAIKQLNLKTSCVALDHWGGDSQAGYFDESIFENFKVNHMQYSEFSSYKKNNFVDSMKEIDNDSIDLIHIDGFHSYTAVKSDFNLALEKIEKLNGIILMHDINEYQLTFGVNKFWIEVESSFKTFRFNHGHGLGVVFVGSRIDSSILELFNSEDLYFSNILRDYFEILGQRTSLFAENTKLVDRSSHLNDEISNLRQIVDEKESDIDKLKIQSEIELLRIRNSFSWKLTSPLRRLSSLFKN